MGDRTNRSRFSENEKRVLSAVLDELIPPRGDRQLPGAGELGIGEYVERALENVPDLRSMIAQGLSDLDESARGRGARGFAELPKEDGVALLAEQAFVLPLSFQAYIGYYQHPRVLAALGLEGRPPHPGGYHMEPNDLTLLDAVRSRPKLYRDC